MNDYTIHTISNPFKDYVAKFDTSKLSPDDREMYSKTIGEIVNEEKSLKIQIKELEEKLEQAENKRTKLFMGLAMKYLK